MGLFKHKKKVPKRKNVSQKVRNGTTLQTRDEFLESYDGQNNIKPNHPNKNDLYRRVVVVDSNRKDELAVVKLTTKGKHKLATYENGKSTYKPIVETKTNKGKSIKIDGAKFVKNKSKKDLSEQSVNKIKKDALKKASSKTRFENKSKLRKLKNRK